MKIFTIPNFITLGNLLCGIVGIIFVLGGYQTMGSFMIFSSLVLDFLDGFVARLLKSSSEIGKQLDSLADVVSFGVLPAIMIYEMLKNINPNNKLLPYWAIFLALASALRLAKFNIDTRQTDSFIGLPTPANAMVVATFPFLISENNFLSNLLNHPLFFIGYVFIFSILLNIELPLLALKFKDFSIKNNKPKYILISFGVVTLIFLKLAAIPLIILFYIIYSWIINSSIKN